MYKIKIILLTITLSGLKLGAFAQHKTINQRVDSVLKLMTLDEKIGQLNQYSGKNVTGPVTKQNIDMLSDIREGKVGSIANVKGVKDTRSIQKVAMQSRLKIPLLFGLDVIHGYHTIFPIPLAESMSWDLELNRSTAHIAAKEAAAAGIHWTFAPMVDIARDPRWGRIMEGAGEDTYLGSQIAKVRILGFQGEKLGGLDAVMACAKHFAAYGAASSGRDYNDVEISGHQLWETYLPPFKAAAEAGVATFMHSFNTVNGVPAAASTYLQRNILKDQWHFGGFIVSDWGSIDQMVSWGYVANKKDAALKAIVAGCDMDMVGRSYLENLKALIVEKRVNVKLIDDAVRRILQKKFELGLFDDPFRFCSESRENEVLNMPEHQKSALRAAERSIVLLKNQNHLLPLPSQNTKIALIGPLANAKRDLQGAWIPTIDTARVVTLNEALQRKSMAIYYAKGTSVKGSDTSGFHAAVKAATEADIVIMALGETFDMSGEAKSRAELGLPGKQMDLFNAVKATGKPVVVVLMAGRPLIINEIADNADAILYAWFPGDEGGNAITNVLYGDYNPSAKLTVTFPRSLGQLPLTYNGYNTGHGYNKSDHGITSYTSGYIDMPNTPRYAFGYGLSYTEFKYADLKLDKTSMAKTGAITATFTLTNTGSRAGEEVVQLYIHDPVASVVQPMKKLKDFQKVALQPGESKAISFKIDNDKLSFYNQQLQWVSEPGDFKLMIGSASDDIRLQTNFKLQ